MKWSWKIGAWRGIEVYVHATFLVLLAFVVIGHWSEGHSFLTTLEGVGFILSLFGCVLLHEFGHALMAARFGIKTKDITLLPIGGLARLERIPEEPSQELWVALAGPAVNVIIAAGLFVWLLFLGAIRSPESLNVESGSFLQRLMVVNVILVLFNMLPAFPMDGGRVLRALLARKMEYARATQHAASIGQGMALILGLLGFFFNPFLMFIALVVWIGATQEAAAVELKLTLTGIPVTQAMQTDFQTLSPSDSLARVIDAILAGSQQDFPVVDDGRAVGILTRNDLLSGLTQRGKDSCVADAMQRDFATVEFDDMLESAFRHLQSHKCHVILVVQRGSLVGVITMENLGEFVAIQSALKTMTKSTAGNKGGNTIVR